MQAIVKAVGIASLCMACLGGCVVVAAVPASFMITEVVPHAINGKGLPEDAADLATGKDCRVIEGIVRKDRQICETRGSPETHKDFKGLSGVVEDRPSAETP